MARFRAGAGSGGSYTPTRGLLKGQTFAATESLSAQRVYENALARSLGYRGASDYRATRESTRYQQFKQEYEGQLGKDLGRGPQGPRQALDRLFAQARGSRDKSAQGPLARLLVLTGRRDPGAQYNVGETP